MAFDFSPSSSATIFIELTNNNIPLVGATVLVSVVNPSNSAIITSAAATEDGEGSYSYSLTPTHTALLGTYWVTWAVTAPITLQRKSIFTVGYEAVFTMTRLEARHQTARLLEGTDGFKTGKVDSATASTFVDLERMEPNLAGWKVYIYGGTGSGQERRIISQVTTTGTYGVSPNWTVTPDSTSLYEIHKDFSVENYNETMRFAVSEVSDKVLCPILDDSLVLVGSIQEYSIPAGFTHIYRVSVNAWSDVWIDVAPGAWDVRRATRKLKLHRNITYGWNGQPIRLEGLRPPNDPMDDSSGLDVKPTYICKKVATLLCLQKIASREGEPAGWTTKYQIFSNETAQELPSIMKLVPNNTKRVE